MMLPLFLLGQYWLVVSCQWFVCSILGQSLVHSSAHFVSAVFLQAKTLPVGSAGLRSSIWLPALPSPQRLVRRIHEARAQVPE